MPSTVHGILLGANRDAWNPAIVVRNPLAPAISPGEHPLSVSMGPARTLYGTVAGSMPYRTTFISPDAPNWYLLQT